MDLGVSGKHVVVTGGAGALGSAVVAALEAAGALAHVPRLEAGMDLTDEAVVERWYAALPSPLWASVHLAGGFAMAAIAETRAADFRAQLELNAMTCFLTCREAVKHIRRAGGGGRIVNVAARVAVVPAAGMIAYATAKAGVAWITRCLAEEVLADGILVNAVLPSIMDTPANRRAMPAADFARWPKVEEVARAIVFLASPANALTSGALVPVYGLG
jgi:NAD(P)-dependent dehydrogenase (short-subunit alcohol dehydrogenase family)